MDAAVNNVPIIFGAELIYLGLSMALTVWVARTLLTNGRIFLLELFQGKEDVADSVNHLLQVGFYLINIGFVTIALKYGDKPHDMSSALEFLSTKIGLVALVLGSVHLLNLYVFYKMRRRTRGVGPSRSPGGVEPAAPPEDSVRDGGSDLRDRQARAQESSERRERENPKPALRFPPDY